MIVILPPDNRVSVNGNGRTVQMDFPSINAVRFDGTTAHVEHRPHEGAWAPPRTLTAEEFDAEFGTIVAAYHAASDDAPESPTVTPAPGALDLSGFDPAKATLPQIAAIIAQLGGKG